MQSFLLERVKSDSDTAAAIADQLSNVLRRCDEISYEDPGTAEAYALLHFLDRFHRFQLTFERLHALRLMPLRVRPVDVLDVGTGPGPSMFALSDFYVRAKGTGVSLSERRGTQGFHIDYVEKSHRFRQWLHHFTEHANRFTRTPWWVPFHHGTFDDFNGLNFTSTRTYSSYDDDGEYIVKTVTIKHRFDLIVFSYFLTSRAQVRKLAKELQDCARNLRHNGILLVVGARASASAKYEEVYEDVHRLIVEGRYSTWRIRAKCKAVKIGDPVLSYSWGSPHGKRLKVLMSSVLAQLRASVPGRVPLELEQDLEKTMQATYKRPIEWQVSVFKKSARPRDA